MKISEIIEELENLKANYGDIKVELDFDTRSAVVREKKIFINYHCGKKDTIQIQNYPY